MSRTLPFTARAALACLALLVGSSSSRLAPLHAAAPDIDRGVGSRVADFTLRDTAGQSIRLYSYAGKKAVVVMFIGTGCPMNDLYLPRLAEIAKKYQSQGVAFLAIDSNSDDEPAAVGKHARQHGVEFPVLMDADAKVADALMAERTCETLVIDGSNARLLYRGAIDDQYTQVARRERPSHNYLLDAIEDLLAGREVALKATAVAGCPLERAVAAANPLERPAVNASSVISSVKAVAKQDQERPIDVGNVSYSGEVAAIMQRKCQECHRPGQVGPFSLLSFDQARSHAQAIREAVAEQRMPPWHADPSHGRFSNNRSLSAQERATLLAWVDQGTPEGDPGKTPASRQFAEGWRIGEPDLVLSMSEPYLVAAQGTLPYQNFRLKPRFKEDVWVQAAEARPGERSVVHHILVLVDEHKGQKQHPETGGYLAVYVPGDSPSMYPEGTAKLIPAGADLVLQVHYTPIGEQKRDLSSVGLIFAKQPPTAKAVTYGIAQTKFAIPPGAENFAVESSVTVPKDIRLLSLFPHMHLRGKSFCYTAHYPSGEAEVLLSVPAYDFGWQSVYRLETPKPLPQGTRIDCAAHFDNSAKNPANPDPTKSVRWGQQTFEEMMIGYVDYSEEAQSNSSPAASGRAEQTVGDGAIDKPLGEWKIFNSNASATVSISEKTLHVTLNRSGAQRISLDAEYAVTGDGVLYATVRAVGEGRGPTVGDVFSFRYQMSGDTLSISGWKGSGVLAGGTILQGTHVKSK